MKAIDNRPLEEQLAEAEKVVQKLYAVVSTMEARFGALDGNTTDAESDLNDAKLQVKRLKILIKKEAK